MVRTIPQIIEDAVPYYKKKGGPDAVHKIVYDSATETLEPVYFFMLDLMNQFGLGPEKLVDNFDSSPGSGHFGELGQRASVMQQQGAKLMGDINTVLRSVLNIIYDLKEFKTRLQAYDDLSSKDKKEAARLSLKQLWLDKVDMQRGAGAIHMMARDLQFVTLRDAFLSANTPEEVKNMDLNERVKRIVEARIFEFNAWLEQSGKELRKRYELEKNYLRSQVNSLKLYSRWAKPYLLSAQKLESSQMSSRTPELVKTFNTIILELTLFGKNKLDVDKFIESGDLPVDFKTLKIKRDYFQCILVQFKFRGIPQRVAQQSHFTFGGRAEITFSSYGFNKDELDKIEEELKKSDVEDAFQLIEGATTESLDLLQDEINYFLEEKSVDKEGTAKPEKDTSNPFLALFGFYEEKKEKSKQEEKSKENKKIEGPVRDDDWIEKTYFRNLAVNGAKDTAFTLFDVYKKAHGMASFTS